MPEYIEREALRKSLLIGAEYLDEDTMMTVVNVLDCFPTADVSPVRHGRWIETPRLYYGAKQYECSLCYSDTFWNKHSIYEKYPHCPNRGAIMDLED